MKKRRHKSRTATSSGELIAKIRKPMAPASKIIEQRTRYDRARQRELERRAPVTDESEGN
jgi:hypothetical protein